jgi:hypothetical protein
VSGSLRELPVIYLLGGASYFWRERMRERRVKKGMNRTKYCTYSSIDARQNTHEEQVNE